MADWGVAQHGGEPRRAHRRQLNPSVETHTDAFQPQKLELKTSCGVWWPKELWEELHPEAPINPKELVSLPGQAAKGVMRELT